MTAHVYTAYSSPYSPELTWYIASPEVCLIWNTQGGSRQQRYCNSLRIRQEGFDSLELSKVRLILPLGSRTIQAPWEFF